jgi:tripartite-type tricarboxylate transporter receptor subunit TctC
VRFSLRKPERLCSFQAAEDIMRTAPLWLAVMACFGNAPAHAAQADNFPSRPLTIVMGASAGGITDVVGRLYAEAASRELGQPVRIDNRPTDAGATAAAAVQNAAPDGYTLLAFQGAQHAAIPQIQRAPYEPVKGFTPVMTLFTLANFLAVPAASPAHSVADLIRLGREKPGGLVFGSSGIGTTSHLTAAQLSLSAKVPVKVTHYAGAAPMIADLISGRLDFTFVSYTVANPQDRQNRIRLLAVDAESRWAGRPEIPTLREAGLDQEKVASWFALAAPAGTPEPVINRLHDAFVRASRDPAVIKGAQESGVLITTSSPEELDRLMAREMADTAELVRKLNLAQP